jgi:hypothetical protein
VIGRNTTANNGFPLDLSNEFAAVRITLDVEGRGPRLFVTNLESGASVHLDPLQLAAFCHATPDQQAQWLRTGDYADPVVHADSVVRDDSSAAEKLNAGDGGRS